MDRWLWIPNRHTQVLKSIPDKAINELANRFSSITGKAVKPYVSKQKYSWTVSTSQGGFDLIFYLHEPPYPTDIDGWDVRGPTVRIARIVVFNKREGKGTKIVQELLRTVQDMGFERVVLDAIPESIPFWRKNGFVSEEGLERCMSITFPTLQPERQTPKPILRINGEQL